MEICHIITKQILVFEKNSFSPGQENLMSHDQDPEEFFVSSFNIFCMGHNLPDWRKMTDIYKVW